MHERTDGKGDMVERIESLLEAFSILILSPCTRMVPLFTRAPIRMGPLSKRRKHRRAYVCEKTRNTITKAHNAETIKIEENQV